MAFFTVGTVLKMALELFLGVSIKLLCDNGRIHWRDLVNDLFFWVPGVVQQEGDGLTRQVVEMHPPVVELETTPLALAAK